METKEIASKIIVEGFWNHGKSDLSSLICHIYGHKLMPEPNHFETLLRQQGEIDEWYKSKYLQNAKEFFQIKNEKIISERSFLDCLAMAYTRSDLEYQRIKEDFKEFLLELVRQHVQVIYLYSTTTQIQYLNVDNSDPVIASLIGREDFISRYDYFFRNILAFDYGIAPICIDMTGAKLQPKTPRDALVMFQAAHLSNRIAQVNIACFRRQDKKGVEFIILKRNEKKGGFWQTISGGVKSDQTILEAVESELKEETCLTLDLKRLSPTGFSFKYTTEFNKINYELNDYAFGYELLPEENIIMSDEHTNIKTVTSMEASRLFKYENSSRILESVIKKIS